MAAAALTLKFVQCEVSQQTDKSSEAEVKRCEGLILQYAQQLAKEVDAAGIQNLLSSIRSFYDLIGKARASKLIRELVELGLSVDQGKKEKIAMLKNCIDWAKDNKREFLRRNLQARLVRLYNEVKCQAEGLKLAHDLISELKKLDDRELLIDVALEESKCAFNLNNFAKARCSLVTAKTNTNGAFISTNIQAAVDMQSGILHSSEDRDFKTSYSYFYEAFEGFTTLKDTKNVALSLKYMILCKIMLNETDQIPGLMATKEMQCVKGPEIDAIRAMSEAFRKRCLKSFQAATKQYKKELLDDKVVSIHSLSLERSMLEKEISRIIAPYSEIELSYIARVIGMTVPPIEKALAKMILDRNLSGCIDQHGGTVVIHPKPGSTKGFTRSLTTVKEITKTVDAAYQRANKHIK